MTTSAKELAFLHDLYISTDWTERFTTNLNENFKFKKVKKLLYVNAGSGNHALELREKMDSKAELKAICESKELLKISKAKAELIKANVAFSDTFPNEKFDRVITDSTFTDARNLADLLAQTVNTANNEVIFFLPTAGSFGEIFSFLWETFFNLDLTEKGSEIERLISDLPTVSALEEMAETVGLKDISSITKVEIFEYENPKEFIESPLIAKFLLPKWLAFLSEKEQKLVAKNLVKVIESDDPHLSFRFSVKATFLTGTKIN